MICLADNDLLLQLAAWNLLPEFQALLLAKFGVALTDIHILFSFIPQLNTRKDWEAQYGRNALDRAIRFCASQPLVHSLPHDSQTVIDLSNVEDIDTGETVLIAVALKQPNCIILTNELKFLGKLASGDPVCVPYCAALQGRILHLRQIIEELLDQKGYQRLAPSIKAQRHSDIRIFNAFQGNANKASGTIREAVVEVERIGPGLLLPLRADMWS